MAGHALQYEQIETYRRCDLRHFDDHDNEYPEPDQVDPGLADHRLDDGHGQDHRRNTVKEHPQNDVEH